MNINPAAQAVETLTQISHLPPSMNGNPILYATTLTAVMCGAVLGLYVVSWMMRDMVRDRKHVGFKSVLFNFRLMMGLAGLAAFVGCLPEVLYLQMYNDPQVPTHLQAAISTMKQVMDSSRIFIIVGWVSILVMIYPYVCLALIDLEDGHGQSIIKYLQVEDYPGFQRLAKPALVFITLAVIAMAFAFSKVYGI